MALLFDARLRAIDSDGNPLVGATLTIYTANTTNPAAVFRDAALATPMTNPTSGPDVSDAGGWFPQIFAPEGTTVDITLKDSGGSSITAWVDVSFLGADTGEFERTLADDTRFKVRGSGGIVYMDFGDPDPDNSGGTAVIGGWGGTQADLITVNAALFNVVGQIKENSKKLASIVSVDAVQVTAQASVDIALPNLPAGTRGWEIEIWDYAQAGNGNLLLRMAPDSAPTTFATAGYAGCQVISEASVGFSQPSAGTSSAQLTVNLNGIANTLGRGLIRVFSPASGSDAVVIHAEFAGVNNSGHYTTFITDAHGPTGAGHLAAVRLLMSTSTATFKYLVRSLRGMGET